MTRLHPQDLRAIVAAIQGYEWSPDKAREKADALLAELERTAKPEPPPEPQAEPCPECGCTWPKNWHWPECSRILPQPAPSVKDENAAHNPMECCCEDCWDELRARVAAIEAAKAGKPKMPVRIHRFDYTEPVGEYNQRFVAWGRLGWDIAAALKVERDRYREALEKIATNPSNHTIAVCLQEIAIKALEGE